MGNTFKLSSSHSRIRPRNQQARAPLFHFALGDSSRRMGPILNERLRLEGTRSARASPPERAMISRQAHRGGENPERQQQASAWQVQVAVLLKCLCEQNLLLCVVWNISELLLQES